MRISDWSDVCSSDLLLGKPHSQFAIAHHFGTNGGPKLVQGQNLRSFAKSHMRAPPIVNPIGGVMAGGFQQVPLQGFNNLNESNKAVLDGEYSGPDGQKVQIDLRMIYNAHGQR